MTHCTPRRDMVCWLATPRTGSLVVIRQLQTIRGRVIPPYVRIAYLSTSGPSAPGTSAWWDSRDLQPCYWPEAGAEAGEER